MKITILNGDMSGNDSEFSTYIKSLKTKLSENSTVEEFTINDIDLNYCIGCWSCWWKTPGEGAGSGKPHAPRRDPLPASGGWPRAGDPSGPRGDRYRENAPAVLWKMRAGCPGLTSWVFQSWGLNRRRGPA